MNYYEDEDVPLIVPYSKLEEVNQELERMQDNYHDINFKYEELKIAVQELFKGKTNDDRLNKLEDFYEYCKENKIM